MEIKQVSDENANAPESTPEFTPITSQDDLNKIISERVNRAKATTAAQFAGFEEYKTKAEQFDQLAEANKTELEKATDRVNELTQELEKAKAAKALSDLAESKGIPVAALDGTPEERAEAIAALVADAGKPRTPAPDPSQGRAPVTPLNGDGLEQKLLAALNLTR
jgi:hypothetical protein